MEEAHTIHKQHVQIEEADFLVIFRDVRALIGNGVP